MKNLRHRLTAFVAGALVAFSAAVFAGLETGTYISDLVATNPLGSDLVSTIDDHIRLLKSTIKATFPNINGAVTVTDEQLNAVGGSGVTGSANPSASIGLSATNGSATTFMRSDAAPALSQSIAPTWTSAHTFTNGFTNGNKGSITASAGVPLIELDESDAAANNQKWWFAAVSEQLNFQIANDARTASGAWLTVDRTANTADSIALTSTALTWNGSAMVNVGSTPTWTGTHTFTKSGGGSGAALYLSAAIPILTWNQSTGASDNKRWQMGVASEQFLLQTLSDADASAASVMLADRTGNTVDLVSFPTDNNSNNFRVGTINTSLTVTVAQVGGNGRGALAASTTGGAGVVPIYAHNQATSGDNVFEEFRTETGAGTTRGNITYNRAGGLVAYNTTSADNLKRNIKPAKSARKLIDCVKVVSHDWKQSDAHMDYWVTAGTLNPCAPFAVTYDKSPQEDGRVDVSKLVPALIKYAQELEQRVDRLEADAARRH